jgi:glycosyltransferase involved in cell wall biosynthesis
MIGLGHSVEIFLLSHTETHLLINLQQIEGVKLWAKKTKKGIYNPFWIFTIRKLLNQEVFDAVHVHLFPAFYWAGLAQYLSKHKNNLFYTEHNTTNRRRNIILFKCLDIFIYRKYNTLITISDSVDLSLKNYIGPSFQNIFKVYNGINLEEINEATAYTKKVLNLPEKAKIILQVSSFTPQKNQQTLIKSINLLDENFHLLLVGDGPTKSTCVNLVQQLGLSQRVHFMGIRSDVPKLLKTAVFVVLSSHFEGLSLASVEGLASGKPFLASNVPGLQEVVKDAGILFENENHNELAQYVLDLSADKSLYRETVLKCKDRAKLFDINGMVKQYIKLYQGL